MVVENDRGWLVAACPACGENSIPHFRVAGKTGPPDIQPFVEQTNQIEAPSAERHVRACADLPHGATDRARSAIEALIKIRPVETASEAPPVLEQPLRLGIEPGRED